jgi:hypothetical protein
VIPTKSHIALESLVAIHTNDICTLLMVPPQLMLKPVLTNHGQPAYIPALRLAPSRVQLALFLSLLTSPASQVPFPDQNMLKR